MFSWMSIMSTGKLNYLAYFKHCLHIRFVKPFFFFLNYESGAIQLWWVVLKAFKPSPLLSKSPRGVITWKGSVEDVKVGTSHSQLSRPIL